GARGAVERERVRGVEAGAARDGGPGVRVWLAWWEDYNPIVYGVYVSREAAVEGVKAQYGPPYIVSWSERDDPVNGYRLIGDFKAVPGYSVKHTAEWSFEERPVEGDAGEGEAQAAIRALPDLDFHREYDSGVLSICNECGVPWPCG